MEDRVVITKKPYNIGLKFTIVRENYSISTYETNDYLLKSFKELLPKIPNDSWKIDFNKKNYSNLCKAVYCDYDPYDDYDDKYHSFYLDRYDNKAIIMDNTLIKSNSKTNGIEYFKLSRYQNNDYYYNEFYCDVIENTILAESIGVALLYPPADISPFSGGNLVLKLENNDEESIYTISPSKFTEWTLITFCGLKYKIEPVTNGIMYIFESKIWSKKDEE